MKLDNGEEVKVTMCSPRLACLDQSEEPLVECQLAARGRIDRVILLQSRARAYYNAGYQVCQKCRACLGELE